MKKYFAMICSAVLLLASLSATAGEFGTRDEAVALTKKAAEFAAANGKDKLVAELNNEKGMFVDRDLYVVSVNAADGTRLSHPYKKELIGKSIYDSKDIDGKAYGEEIMDVAETKGEGWVEYKFTDPATKKIADKESYVMKAGDLVLFCGAYKR